MDEDDVGIYRVASQLDAVYRDVRERRAVVDPLVHPPAELDPS